MAAFTPYSGAYEFAGRTYAWRCYATRPVYAGRLWDHAELELAIEGRRWVRNERHASERLFAWLVDDDDRGFSQILAQVWAAPPAPLEPTTAAERPHNKLEREGAGHEQ